MMNNSKETKRLKNINRTCEKILDTLAKLGSKYQKLYCYPSQDKLMELLKRYYKINCGKRALNYALKYLEENGYFKRQQRSRRDNNGNIIPLSTLYIFTNKFIRRFKGLFKFVNSMAEGYKYFYNQILLKKQENKKEEDSYPSFEQAQANARAVLNKIAR